MPRKNRLQNLTDEEKKLRRREQKKLSMRRARAKLTEADVEEIRKKDRERYHKKKDRGDIKTIDQYTPRQQRQIRKMWREKSKKRRELLKMRKATDALIQEDTPPSSPSASFSRVESGRAVAARNKRARLAENEVLKKKVLHMGKVIKKYRMRIRRLEERKQKASKSSSKNKVLKTDIRKAVHDFLMDDEYSRLTAGKNETITRNKNSDDSDEIFTQNLPLRLNKRPRFSSSSDDVSLPKHDERSRFRSDSDDSDVIFTPRHRHPLPTDSSGEGDFIVRPQQSQKPFVDPYTDSDNDE
ncbi:DEAD-box ATP-dependent RNA helicase 42-like [Spodoptera litura]|uniref:DEAD-box ATP-dependent RNA helicase 42-like n=1 Tax=Spodoptera litura TaxID=69820 RepID=A0A9J7EWB6_SPOLT|nr:DEAD-box ATP-dependent RNA helicase 42-like [Spodoptera litura]